MCAWFHMHQCPLKLSMILNHPFYPVPGLQTAAPRRASLMYNTFGQPIVSSLPVFPRFVDNYLGDGVRRKVKLRQTESALLFRPRANTLNSRICPGPRLQRRALLRSSYIVRQLSYRSNSNLYFSDSASRAFSVLHYFFRIYFEIDRLMFWIWGNRFYHYSILMVVRSVLTLPVGYINLRNTGENEWVPNLRFLLSFLVTEHFKRIETIRPYHQFLDRSREILADLASHQSHF